MNSLGKFIICLFFGTLGIHKLFEKKYFIAIIYFLTYGLFGIGWIVDCIKYFMEFLNERKMYEINDMYKYNMNYSCLR